jgi:hypothetical protein
MAAIGAHRIVVSRTAGSISSSRLRHVCHIPRLGGCSAALRYQTVIATARAAEAGLDDDTRCKSRSNSVNRPFVADERKRDAADDPRPERIGHVDEPAGMLAERDPQSTARPGAESHVMRTGAESRGPESG